MKMKKVSHDPETINVALILLRMHSRIKRRCGRCLQCTKPDCAHCINCLDKKVNGGLNIRKRGCLLKTCVLYTSYSN